MLRCTNLSKKLGTHRNLTPSLILSLNALKIELIHTEFFLSICLAKFQKFKAMS